MEIKRLYYTLDQAADSLEKYNIEDLMHFIETDQIPAVIFCKGKKFAAVRKASDKIDWVAHGFCYYSGLLSVHKSWIKSLWEKGSIVLNKASYPLNRQNIQNWSKRYPYKHESLKVGFNAWHPLELHEIPPTELYLIPFAVEGVSIVGMIDKFAESISKPSGIMINGQPVSEPKKEIWKSELKERDRFAYSFIENGKFTIDDLRLTSEVVERLGVKKSSISVGGGDSKPSKVESELNSLPWNDSQKGGARINEPLERLFRYSPNQPAKNYWRLLREEYEQFDPDKVIEQVTNGEIHWYTRSDEPKVMAYKTFENKISNIKKFYRENRIEVDG
ncbi:MAG: hypothetical protein V7785_24940 [Bermanella sp.]